MCPVDRFPPSFSQVAVIEVSLVLSSSPKKILKSSVSMTKGSFGSQLLSVCGLSIPMVADESSAAMIIVKYRLMLVK